ncbi:MAG: hypothetical protein HC904_01135 [Blastochloris sp.]|nr:hypothetical protein [Blastochloris sp.]
MDRKTIILVAALGLIAGLCAYGARRQYNLKKARALRASFRPHYTNGCYMVKIVDGPAWSIGEFGTFDASSNRLLIEGEDFDAQEFEFILA